MMIIKVSLFLLIIVTIKFIFIYINDIGDKKIKNMKELIDFTDYLRMYSCDLKMPFEEIMIKYNFKNLKIKNICTEMLNDLKNNFEERTDKSDLKLFIKESIMTPNDFNNSFSEITGYYGNSYSELLDKKLNMTIKEMQKYLNEYESSHKEKKNLYNRISLLVGCLTAVILI